MITEDKVTEIFCMADDFCKFFNALMAFFPFFCRFELGKSVKMFYFRPVLIDKITESGNSRCRRFVFSVF